MSSFQARLESTDAPALTRLAAGVSFALPAAMSYNLPLMLFGVISFELSSTAPHQFFLRLLIFAGIFDILNLRSVAFFSLQGIAALVVLLAKVPIYFGGLSALRDRGGDLSWNRGNFMPPAWVPTSLSGGQTLGSGPSEPAAPAAPGAFPSGGFRLGGDDGAQPPPRTTRDGYTSIA